MGDVAGKGLGAVSTGIGNAAGAKPSHHNLYIIMIATNSMGTSKEEMLTTLDKVSGRWVGTLDKLRLQRVHSVMIA